MGNELHAELVNEDQCEYLDSYISALFSPMQDVPNIMVLIGQIITPM